MPPPASTPSSTLTTGTPTTTPSLRPVEISLTTLYSNDITGGLVVLGHTITTKGAGGQFSVLTVTDTTVAVTAATTLSTSSSGTPPTSQPSQSTPTVYTTTVYTPTPSHTRNEPQRSNGLQDHAGEVAGIAIGVGLALAFVAFLITFVVMRRKKHTSGPRRHDGEKPNNSYLSAGSIRDPQGDPGSKHPIVTDLSVVAGPNRGLETHLPPSADDSTVRNKISTLNEQIGLHVENFYHKSGIPIPPGAEAGLADFESPYLPGTLALLFQQARSGVPIIKHCLAGLILSRISPSGDPKNTFLPTEFVGLPHALEKTRSGKQKAPGALPGISLMIHLLTQNQATTRLFLAGVSSHPISCPIHPPFLPMCHPAMRRSRRPFSPSPGPFGPGSTVAILSLTACTI